MNTMHNLLFYPRLAGTNVKKNSSIYYPYLFAGSLMAGLLYVLNSVADMVADSGMEGGDIMHMLVRICFFICILTAGNGINKKQFCTNRQNCFLF